MVEDGLDGKLGPNVNFGNNIYNLTLGDVVDLVINNHVSVASLIGLVERLPEGFKSPAALASLSIIMHLAS